MLKLKPTIGLLFCLLLPSVVSAASPITINSGRGEPFVSARHNGFYDLIVRQMFARIGLRAKTIELPSERSLINANTGIDDGNIARIKGISKKYKNLLMVPGKIIDFDFVVFSKNRKLKITNWKSLKPYNVAFINGWKLFEKKVTYYRTLLKPRDSTQLFELLKYNRVDIALYDMWSGLWWIKQNNSQIKYLSPPIATFELYMYIHKKHKKLIPGLAQALAVMKKDGTYQAIFNKTLGKLL